MKKNKKRFSVLSFLALSALTITIALSVGASVFSLAALIEIVEFEDTYDFIDTTGNFKCTVINSTDKTVSISWADIPENATGDIEISKTLLKPDNDQDDSNNETYTVVGINDGGFRGCKMKTISVPSSVTSIGKEAFAYCTSLETFNIPHLLTEISPSAFLDCRALENIFFRSYKNIAMGKYTPSENDAGLYFIDVTTAASPTLYCKDWASISTGLEIDTVEIESGASASETTTPASTSTYYIYKKVTGTGNDVNTSYYLFKNESGVWKRKTNVTTGDSNPTPGIYSGGFYIKSGVDPVLYQCSWQTVNSNNVTFAFHGPSSHTFSSTPANNDYFVDTTSYTVHQYNSSNSSWSDKSGDYTNAFSNSMIQTVGDHAFDSCVSLKSFSIPTTITSFGEGCFQNCSTIYNLYFPSAKKSGNAYVKNITIESYAFAHCSSLSNIYMEENMLEIKNYAFVDCNSNLRIKFTGQKKNYKDTSDNNENFYFNSLYNGSNHTYRDAHQHWRDTNIDSNIGTKIPVDEKENISLPTNLYPGLRYFVTSDDVLLDSAQDRRPTVSIISNSSDYVVISKFDTPSLEVPGYYETVSLTVPSGNSTTTINVKKLTIPDEIDGKPVKVIGASAFANNEDIEFVVFSQNLVQIRNHAFYKCPNIRKLDFLSCENLLEIGYCIFTDLQYKTPNTLLEAINLPSCLEYIGDQAFAYMQKVNELSFNATGGDPCIKVIGDSAFLNMGQDLGTGGKVDLVLPKSLSDQAAEEANFYHINYPTNPNQNWSKHGYYRWCAVGKYAFSYSKAIKTVEMEEDDDENSTYTCSFYSNAFGRCSNLFRFKTNRHLKTIGNDFFKDCPNLRELFLSTKGADNSIDYPWGVSDDNDSYGGALFAGGSSPELVIYVDGDKAPGKLDTFTNTLSEEPVKDDGLQKLFRWNTENKESYVSDLQIGGGVMNYSTRSHVATTYGADYEDGGIQYWTYAGNAAPSKRDNPPQTLDDYKKGIIALVEDTNNADEYIVARYFTDYVYNSDQSKCHVKDKIDLATITDLPTVNAIGDEAFASNTDDKNPSKYFVLPDTITKIGERAFYRKGSPTSRGVKIITYYDSAQSKIAKAAPVDDSYLSLASFSGSGDDTLDKYITNIANNKSFCCLPGGLKNIGINAFYNNNFEYVYIGSDLEFLGNGAFYTSGTTNSKISKIVISSDVYTYSKTENNNTAYYNGIYCDGVLLYQACGISDGLTIASGTKAIGMRAAACSSYTSVTLCDGLTSIYGGAFQNSTSLNTVDGDGLADLEYISSTANSMIVCPSYYIDKVNETLYKKVGSSLVLADDTSYTFSSTEPTGIESGYCWIDNSNYTLKIYESSSWVSQENVLTSDSALDMCFWNEDHYNNYDFPDFSYENRKYIQSMHSAFAGCTSLSTIDFTQMENIKKIGQRAFYKCSALINMTPVTEENTWHKYSFNRFTGRKMSSDGSTVTTQSIEEAIVKKVNNQNMAATEITSTVLDLRNCTNLVSIGRDAFYECNNIKYVMTPNRTNTSAGESELYIGYDPQTPIWGEKGGKAEVSQSIFKGSSSISILVGEDGEYSNPSINNNSSKKHYNTNCFGSGNPVYYPITGNQQAGTVSGIKDGDHETYKYWTRKSIVDSNGQVTEVFLLFETAHDARIYFHVHCDPTGSCDNRSGDHW